METNFNTATIDKKEYAIPNVKEDLLLDSSDSDTEYQLNLERVQINEEKLQMATQYGEQLFEEISELKKTAKELNSEKIQIQEDIKRVKEQSHQKRIDAFDKMEQKKMVDVHKAENELLTQDVISLRKNIKEQKKYLKQIEAQFYEGAEIFEQRKIEYKKNVDELQCFNIKKKELTKECEVLFQENLKHKNYASKFESEFRKLEDQYKVLKQTEAQKLDRISKGQLENKKLINTAKIIAQHADESQKGLQQDAQFIKEQHNQIEDLKRRINNQKRMMLASAETPKCDSFKSLPVLIRSQSLQNEVQIPPSKKKPIKKPQKKLNLNMVEKEFFLLNCMAVKMTSGHNMDETMGISTETLWKKAVEQRIQFHQFHDWIEQQITKVYFQSRFKNPKKRRI